MATGNGTSKGVVTPRWWGVTANGGHDFYTEYGERICLKCGRRWLESETDIPDCEYSKSKVTPYGINCIRELKKLFKETE